MCWRVFVAYLDLSKLQITRQRELFDEEDPGFIGKLEDMGGFPQSMEEMEEECFKSISSEYYYAQTMPIIEEPIGKFENYLKN